MSTLIISLGRYGDVISILPCAQHIAKQEGGICYVMVCPEFADVLEGCSYVEPVIFPGAFTDLNGAMNQVRKLEGRYVVLRDAQGFQPLEVDRVLVAKVADRAVGVTTQCESFNEEAWRQLGCLHLWNELPLEFDRRDRAREEALYQKTLLEFDVRGPYSLYNFSGKSSPLPEGEFWLERNAKLLAGHTLKYGNWVNLAHVRAHRIYDLLMLMEEALVLVTSDTATLHLAAASKVPVVNLLQTKPTKWHGSRPRNNSVLEMRYSEIRDLTEPLNTKPIHPD